MLLPLLQYLVMGWGPVGTIVAPSKNQMEEPDKSWHKVQNLPRTIPPNSLLLIGPKKQID
jgi:hypothetical protein